MTEVIIYSDGSCLGNPGAGGWAYKIVCKSIRGKAVELSERYIKRCSGGEALTTNNRMELTAAIEALKALKIQSHVELYTDSQYVASGINEWMEGWIKRKWKNVKNTDLWFELLALTKTHKVKAHWVRGHAGHPDNEECDKMAFTEAQKAKQNKELA